MRADSEASEDVLCTRATLSLADVNHETSVRGRSLPQTGTVRKESGVGQLGRGIQGDLCPLLIGARRGAEGRLGPKHPPDANRASTTGRQVDSLRGAKLKLPCPRSGPFRSPAPSPFSSRAGMRGPACQAPACPPLRRHQNENNSLPRSVTSGPVRYTYASRHATGSLVPLCHQAWPK